MMLKTVYGPPPTDMERIEAAEDVPDNELVRDNIVATRTVSAEGRQND